MNEEFNLLNKTWNELGKTCTYWSVITNEKYRPERMTSCVEQDFYKTGVDDATMIENILQKHGSTLRDRIVLDFGCGVGRIIYGALSGTFSPKHVFGCDISLPHLQEAHKHVPNATYFHMSEPNSIPDFPEPPEVIYSLIVLQHNRPSLMMYYIRQILSILKKDGIAVLHIPYFIYNYTETHISAAHLGVMEMHYIKIKDVKDIVKESSCTLLEINEDRDMCGGGIKNALFVIKKD